MSIAMAITQIKRGCQPISEMQQKANISKYISTITTAPRPIDDNEVIDIVINDTICREVKRLPRDEIVIKPITPHGSSCYEYSIAYGGALQDCRIKIGDVPHCPTDVHPEYVEKKYVDILSQSVEVGVTIPVFNDREIYNLTTEPCGIVHLLYQQTSMSWEDDWQLLSFERDDNNHVVIREHTEEPSVNDYEDGRYRDSIECGYEIVEEGYPVIQTVVNEDIFGNITYETIDYLYQAVLGQINDPIMSKVHGILEPLKMRTITASHGLFQTFGVLAQKAIFKSYTQLPEYELTSRPPVLDDITKVIRDMKDDEFMVSGDYSSATDYINMNFTKKVYHCICDHLGFNDTLRTTGIRLLTENQLDFSKWGFTELKSQQNGQLMGCIVSFPILSILNCCTVRAAERLLEMEFGTCRRRALRVNGDDILFPSNEQFYTAWRKVIDYVGFRLSPGKNYRSKNFCMIDSILYAIRSSQGHEAYPLMLPFPNVGLAMGQSKVLSDTRVDSAFAVSPESNLRAFRWSCQNARYTTGKSDEQLYKEGEKIFFEEKLESLKLSSKPWYLPEALGGLGLRPESGVVTGDHARLWTYYNSLSFAGKLEMQTQLCPSAMCSELIDATTKRYVSCKTSTERPTRTQLSAADDWLDHSISVLSDKKAQPASIMKRWIRRACKALPRVDSINWDEVLFLQTLDDYSSGVDLRPCHTVH